MSGTPLLMSRENSKIGLGVIGVAEAAYRLFGFGSNSSTNACARSSSSASFSHLLGEIGLSALLASSVHRNAC
jgi:hypothetical protein